MRKKTRILLCAVLLGLSTAGCLALPRTVQEGCGRNAKQAVPAKMVAWWSLTCEMPNPERLPVQVRFQWLKGLE